MALAHEEIDAREAARRLGQFRLWLAAEGHLLDARAVDRLHESFGPNAAYRIIFEGDTVDEEMDRSHRCALPPFDRALLAPPRSRGIPGAHRSRLNTSDRFA